MLLPPEYFTVEKKFHMADVLRKGVKCRLHPDNEQKIIRIMQQS